MFYISAFNHLFIQLWYQYDSDKSGYIEADELKVCRELKIKENIILLYYIKSFLHDLLFEARRSQEVTEEKLIEYTDTLLQIFDNNKDGKLQLSEMAQYVSQLYYFINREFSIHRLLPVKENFLTRQIFKVIRNFCLG